MVQCCDPNGLNSVFDTGRAAADARRYRRKGLTRETRAILGMLVDRGVEGATVLEIGEGIGDLLIELLRAGASRATGVEISPPMKTSAGSSRPSGESRSGSTDAWPTSAPGRTGSPQPTR